MLCLDGTSNFSSFDLIAAPVRGLRPVRAARLPTANVPKPTRETVPPLLQGLLDGFNGRLQARSGCPGDIGIVSDVLDQFGFVPQEASGIALMECLGYLAFARQNASLKSVSSGRGMIGVRSRVCCVRQSHRLPGCHWQHAVLRRRCVNSSLISAPRRACSVLSPPCRMSGYRLTPARHCEAAPDRAQRTPGANFRRAFCR